MVGTSGRELIWNHLPTDSSTGKSGGIKFDKQVRRRVLVGLDELSITETRDCTEKGVRRG